MKLFFILIGVAMLAGFLNAIPEILRLKRLRDM
jgi:hypothetical protein